MSLPQSIIERGCLFLSGERLSRSDPRCHEKLREAHRTRIRPRCLCVTDGVEMYISQVGDNYIVKRMPGTARRHSLGCDRFDVLADSYQPPLRVMHVGSSDSSGRVDLRLAFSLNAITVCAENSNASRTHAEANDKDRGLSMCGLLQYLWNEAELTRWSPSFEGRRNWGTIYRRLRGAAFNKWVEGDPLLTRLLIPIPFVSAHRAHIWNSTRTFLEGLRPDQHKTALVIAEVKKVSAKSGDPKVTLKHLPFLRFHIGHAALAASRRAMQSISHGQGSRRSRHIAIAVIRVDQFAQPSILKMHVSEFDDHWLPTGPAAHSG